MKDLKKTYHIKNCEIKALSGINLEVEDKSFVTVVGRSGSGKTTLLRGTVRSGGKEWRGNQLY